MRLVTFRQPGSAPEAGIIEGGRVQGLGVDMITVCATGRVPDARGPSFDLAAVKLMAPVPRPPKLICVGLNYRDHAAESRSEIPKVPTIFSKFSNVVIGPKVTVERTQHIVSGDRRCTYRIEPVATPRGRDDRKPALPRIVPPASDD